MVVVFIAAIVVGLFLLRRLVRGPKVAPVTVVGPKPYHPDRAHFQRLPGRKSRSGRGL